MLLFSLSFEHHSVKFKPKSCKKRSTSVMMGAQVSVFHCEVHSCCLEQTPEHQPQSMKRGAVRHMRHVTKCAHPGPADGTLNILMKERGSWGWTNPDSQELKKKKAKDKQYFFFYLISNYKEKWILLVHGCCPGYCSFSQRIIGINSRLVKGEDHLNQWDREAMSERFLFFWKS